MGGTSEPGAHLALSLLDVSLSLPSPPASVSRGGTTGAVALLAAIAAVWLKWALLVSSGLSMAASACLGIKAPSVPVVAAVTPAAINGATMFSVGSGGRLY